MRKIGLVSALAVFAAAPLAAQSFRTGTLDTARQAAGRIGTIRIPGGGVIGQPQDTAARKRAGKSGHIPPGQLPPAGMCRVWIDGVPPGQQPAPTDCQTAVATKPANARVIFGGDGSAFPGKANGKLKAGKHGKDRVRGDDRDDDDDDKIDRDRGENRGRGKSLAKRGRKG
jgi:hypothetical protein